MTNRPLILVTNDDGINSPGLHAAAEAVADLGDLLIVAPTFQQSGAGRSFLLKADRTIHPTTICVNGQQHPAYKADVTPAQAVVLALVELAQRPIDLCLSGINYGENIGSGITASGTVGAALEAASANVPALAISLGTPEQYYFSHSREIDFSTAAHFTRYFAQKTLKHGLPARVDLLKIDVPATATAQTPWRTASISRQRYFESVKPQKPSDRDYQIYIDHDTLEPESDIYVFAVDKQVAVAPMTIDLTAPIALESVVRFFNGKSG
ncbi:MAG: 5'/3'-nucleotidase SurE [Anaerolineae bacterium]|nr:5'/3'-nucleotidase SurE [Anaerolineae bacterium]